MSRVGRTVVAAVLAALTLAACGIPRDQSPQVLSDADIGPLSNTAAVDAASAAGGQRIYFFTSAGATESLRLQAVNRSVPANVGNVLSELFKGVSDAEKAQRLSSQIPVGTRLLGVSTVREGTVEVNVDQTINRAQNNLYAAVAQIVYTATSVPGVERVRLLVDGAPKSWPGDDRVERTGELTPLAYPTLYPVSQPDLPPVPSPIAPTTQAATSTTVDGPTTTMPAGPA